MTLDMKTVPSRSTVFASLLLCTITISSHGDEPKIISVKEIWDEGKHNAFTDLIRFHDRWWCTFREAEEQGNNDRGLAGCCFCSTFHRSAGDRNKPMN